MVRFVVTARSFKNLEGTFRGAGWEVIKVIWGSYWDPLIARDKDGKLLDIMESTVDGEYQNYKAKGGKYTRDNFFAKTPETAAMVANMSDADIWRLNRGGHDPVKVYAAYDRAVNTKGRPQVILAKTVKGYGMGDAGEGKNIAHGVKKMDIEALNSVSATVSPHSIFLMKIYQMYLMYTFPEDSEEYKYMRHVVKH